MPEPMTAVTVSIMSVVRRVLIANTAPAAAGAAKLTTACMEALIPLYRISCSFGTSCGITAFTAGVCMPAPSERMADMTSRAASKAGFDVINGTVHTMTRVAKAMRVSAPMISIFLGYRSAHTPPTKESINWGR